MQTPHEPVAANRQELVDLLVELSRWSGVAEKNGDLHARIASALALESSAAEQSVGERQGRQPAQDLGQNGAESVISSSWEKADPLSDPTSGQGANAKPGLTDAPNRDAASLRVGQYVRHYASGWTGIVASIRDDDSGLHGTQGPLVTVDPVYAGGKEWRGITVTREELEVIPDA